MSDKEKIYQNIIDTITESAYSFWCEYGREPNKIVVSADVFNYLDAFCKELLCYFAEDKVNRIMGMDIDIVYDKKGYIEVGFMKPVPYTINTEYSTKGSEENG